MFRRALIRAAFIAIAVVIGSCLVAARPARAAGDPASAFLAKINALRASKGVAPLQMNGALTSFAAGWTSHMVQTNTLAHNPSLAAAPNNWSVLGENVGDGGSVDDIFNGFAASSHHYANMVDPRFNIVGISVQVDSSGRMWTTHDFEQVPGATTAARAPVPSPAPSKPAAPKPAPRPVTPKAAAAPAPAPASPAPVAAPAPAPAPEPPVVPVRIKFSLEALGGGDPAF